MRKDKLRHLLMLGAGGLLGLLSLASISYANTVIDDGYLYADTIWKESGNPYIIEDTVFIPRGYSLYIDPGVNIIASSSLDGSSVFRVEGNLYLKGNVEKNIKISGQGDISVSSGNLNIKYSEILLSSGIYSYDSLINISSSTISGAKDGLDIKSSRVNITGSLISGNKNGLYIRNHIDEPVFQVNNQDSSFGIGGIGNALFAQVQNEPSLIKIEHSSILDNIEAGIKNEDTSYVQAGNNWWGRESGPGIFGANKIIGNISYIPWLTEDPLKSDPLCCSNILFIPGLQGSRLYSDRIILPDNRLWEPNRNADVEKLYLDQYGSSTPNIYSSDPIGKAYGLKDVYGKFMDYLDGLEKENKINQWKAFGYDWRMPITEVVAGKIGRISGLATTTKSLSDLVSELASRSKTGKINIVAHSNGGLVAKYLIKILEEQGKAGLIDKIVSVAVPYLGTPQAIVGLLHGYGQSIAGGIFLNEAVARGLGQNMSSAYSLLPSRNYFSTVFSPTITFASSTINNINNGSYPTKIKTFEEQVDFITDSKNSRIVPLLSDTEIPLKANRNLLIASDIIHGLLDFYHWPIAISKWAIAGWNKKTADSLVYYNESCNKKDCISNSSFKVDETLAGDGTVVFPSASYNSGELVSLDLKDLSEQEKRDIAHANILGASSTIVTVDKILNTPKSNQDQSLINEIAKIPGVTIGQPDFSKEPISLELSTHSPVDLHVYDSSGRHTGLAQIPTELIGEIDSDLLSFYDNDIPGSSFNRIRQSDGTYKNYISLPDDNGEKYDVVIKGNNFGIFKYVVERKSNNQVLDSIAYENIPITPFAVASTTIIARENNNTPLPKLSSTLPTISLDLDGNGTVDMVATSSLNENNTQWLNAIRRLVILYSDNKGRTNSLLKRLDVIESLVKKGKLSQKNGRAILLREYSGHLSTRQIPSTDRTKILKMIEIYISQFE